LLIMQTFTYSAFVLSLINNSLFIWTSATTKSMPIGRYRYLMTGFAVMDILVATTHLVLMPGIQLTSAGYIFFGYHLVEQPAVVGTWAVTLFVIFLYQTFIILALHYVYRYAVVCEPRWRKIFAHHTTFWWSCISTCVLIMYTYGYLEAVQIGLLPSQYKREFFHDALLNYSGVDNAKRDFGYFACIFRVISAFDSVIWQNDAIAAILIAISLFGFTAIVIATCSILIIRKL
ncbi:hypothetical protein PMAYCL1PPCAC_14820, partial [Pristionchus mayeri]